MSEPIHSINSQIVTNGDMTTTITSTAVEVDESITINVQATWTGSPVGTIELQVSNNPTLLGYTTINASVSAVSGPGTYSVNYERIGFSYVQLVYIPTSGSGTLNAVLNAKRN